jgi:hypothetical protein
LNVLCENYTRYLTALSGSEARVSDLAGESGGVHPTGQTFGMATGSLQI